MNFFIDVEGFFLLQYNDQIENNGIKVGANISFKIHPFKIQININYEKIYSNHCYAPIPYRMFYQ